MNDTPLSVGVLQNTMGTRGWNQLELAERCKLNRSVVSMQLSRQRPIRDEHLACYLEGLPTAPERRDLLAAWLRDLLAAEVIADVFKHHGDLRQAVLDWSPKLDEEQNQMLTWWASQMPKDPELDQLFRSLSTRAGYQPPPPPRE